MSPAPGPPPPPPPGSRFRPARRDGSPPREGCLGLILDVVLEGCLGAVFEGCLGLVLLAVLLTTAVKLIASAH